MPALTVTLALSLVAAWFLFLPTELMYYGRSLAATSAFSSNILFYREAGYFDPSAWTKPLLHTWSLAVEEQFYIFFPIYVAVVMRFARRHFIALTFVGLCFSFCVSEALLAWDKQPASFYNLPTRAWELLIGSMLAIGAIRIQFSEISSNILSLLGLGMIIASGFLLNDQSPFPGINALWPTLGTAIILYTTACREQKNSIRTLLSHPWIVYIGRISYSFYLFHWPILVFGKYYMVGQDTLADRLLMVAASGALACLSYHFIEQPVRQNRKVTRRALFLSTTAVSFFFIGAGMHLYKNQGAPLRFSQEVINLAQTGKGMPDMGEEFGEGRKVPLGKKEPLSAPVYAVWGDSHANSLSPALNKIGQDQNVFGYVYRKAGCFPSTDLTLPSKDECKDVGTKAFAELKAQESIKTVILVGRWSAYPRWWKESDSDEDREKSFVLFEKALNDTVQNLQTLGKKVIIITEPPPVRSSEAPSAMARALHYGTDVDISASHKEFLENTARLRAIIKTVADNKSVPLIGLDESLCVTDHCDSMVDGKSLYYDSDHLSTFGALRLAPFLNEKIDLSP